MIRPLLRLFLAIPLSLFFVMSASAAVVTWDGGGLSDTLWSNCNNWTSNTCPTSSDIATFDVTSITNTTIGTTLTGATAPAGIDINVGYTGVITQNAGVSITIGASNFDQAAGTFTGGDSSITINGSFTLSSGTFTSTSGILSVQGNWTHTAGGTFSHNNGTLRGIGSTDATYNFATTETFYNFVLDKTNNYQHTISSGDTMLVNNAVTLTEGRLQGTGTIEVKSTVSFASTYDHGSANWKFSGTGDQTLTLYDTDDNINGSVTVDKASGAFLLGSALTLDCGGTVCNFTITQGTVNLSGFDFRSNDFTLSSGTFTTGAATVDVDDDLTLTDGIFNASTGTTRLGGDFTHISGTGTFSHNNGTFIFDTGQDQTINVSTSETFYNVTMDKGNFLQTISAGDTIVVTGALNLTNGRFGTGTIQAQGSVTVAPTYDSDTSTLKFTGNASQTFTLTGAEALFDGPITIDKSGGTVTLASGLTMNAGKAFTMTNGTFDMAGYAFTQNSTYSQSSGTFTSGAGSIDIDGTFTLSGGTFTATSGTMTLGAAFNHTAGGTFAHNNGTVEFDGSADVTLDVATSETFYNLTMNKTGFLGTIASGDTFIILNALNLTNGRFGTGTLQAQGSVTVGSGYDTGTAVLTFSGSEVQTFTLTGAEALFDGDINVNKTGGAVNLASALTMNAFNQDLTIQEGTFDLSGYTLIVQGAGTEKLVVETGGNLQLQGGETITGDSASYPQLDSGSTVTYDGTVGPYTLKNYTYHHLTINGAGATFSPADNEVLGGDLTVTAGTFDINDLTLAINGNTLINGGTVKSGTNTVTFGNAGGDTVTISSGGLEIESDSPGADIVKNATTWTNSGGTITYNAATGIVGVVLSGLSPYYNLTINSSGSTYSLQALTDVDGNLTISAGTLDAGNGGNFNMTVGANWANAGTFTARTGTVTFDSASATTISGNTTFNNFTCTTANKALTFTAGTTQTISGLITLTGTAGNLIVLRSSSNDSAWNLTVNGTSSMDYVNVRDSNAGGGNAITHAVSPSRSVSVANNTNWSFNVTPTVSTVTAVQGTDGSGDVVVTFIMDDADDDNTLQGKVEYSLNGGSSWADPTLSIAGSETFATYGDPSIDNAVTYQVGQAGAYITSSSGANTVSIVWEAGTDVASSTDVSNARIRITPYDGTAEGSTGSSADFVLDRVAPSGLTSFSAFSYTPTQVNLIWSAVAEGHFNHYEIWYGEDQTAVQNRSSGASEWDNSDDATLATASTTRSTIMMDPGGKCFKIFAIDNYGNESTVVDFNIATFSSGSGTGFVSGSGTSGSTTTSSGGSSSGASEGGDTEGSTIANPWKDYEVPDHWSSGYIKYLEEQDNIVEVAVEVPTFTEILQGMFEEPDVGVDRGEAVEFLVALVGYQVDTLTVNTRELGFSDVGEDNERLGVIQFAFEQGLVGGYADGTFHPERVINRAEILKLVSHFFGIELDSDLRGEALLAHFGLTENPFSDVDLEAWYAPYILHAYANGVVSGYGDGTFGPGNEVTYAEFLKIAVLYQNIESAVELASELE